MCSLPPCFVATADAQTQPEIGKLYQAGNKGPAENFTGTAMMNMLANTKNGINCTVVSVSFEAGARTNWHSHKGGQVLLVTEGEGYYKEKDQKLRVIKKGDVVICPANVEHFHGGAPNSTMTHVAVAPDIDEGATTWLRKVDDSEYVLAD